MENLKPTGVFATQDQHDQVRNAYQIDYYVPVMAVLPNGEVPRAQEDFRVMANRFAVENGLPPGQYAIHPETKEFFYIRGE